MERAELQLLQVGPQTKTFWRKQRDWQGNKKGSWMWTESKKILAHYRKEILHFRVNDSLQWIWESFQFSEWEMKGSQRGDQRNLTEKSNGVISTET